MKKAFLSTFIIILVFNNCKKPDVNFQPYNTEHTIDWMQDLIAKYSNKNITLKDICLPRAHDAGMYEVNNCYAGNACNTQTQNRTMQSMLESGIRVFDVRPVLKEGAFWTYHATHCEGFGCEGVLFETFLEDTKNYLDKHNELLIFDLGHFCNTSADDAALLDLVNTKLGNTVYKTTSTDTVPIINKPLKDIINENTGGKVILRMDGLIANDETSGYFKESYLPVSGSYANNPDAQEMKADQLAKFNSYNSSTESLFRISWTVTMDNALAVGCFNEEDNPLTIKDITKEATNLLEPTIDEWIENGTIQKDKIPNIFSVDFADILVTEQCIKISEFNLN